MKRLAMLIVLLIIIIPVTTQAQFWKKKNNQRDKQNKKIGLWTTYWDDENTQLMTKNYFKEGRETKVCKNFHPNGKISVKFKYLKDRIKVKYYNENGKILYKGWSIIEFGEKVHYYWHGRWKFYESGHNLVRAEMYLNGALLTQTVKHYSKN